MGWPRVYEPLLLVPLNAAISAETCAARESISGKLDAGVAPVGAGAGAVAAGAGVTAATVVFPAPSVVWYMASAKVSVAFMLAAPPPKR